MKHLSFFQRCTAFLIDCTVAVFTFNIVAWVISYFYFVPFLPGFFIIWLLYYVISFCFCGQTFGLAFFNGKMVSSAGGSPSWLSTRGIKNLLHILLLECAGDFFNI